jgi:hypothetical protein
MGIVLGHVVSSKGIEVDKPKVDLILNLPTPKIVRDVRSILGHAGFYKRFIKDFSSISRPFVISYSNSPLLSGQSHVK